MSLPLPNQINTGGYAVPSARGTLYAYSSVDLFVCGLEADYRGEEVKDLVNYFTKHRAMFADSWVNLAVYFEEDNRIQMRSILEWKHIVRLEKNSELLKMFKRNAPLTFKWERV